MLNVSADLFHHRTFTHARRTANGLSRGFLLNLNTSQDRKFSFANVTSFVSHLPVNVNGT